MTNRMARARAAASRVLRMHNAGRIDAVAAFEAEYTTKRPAAYDLFGSNMRRDIQAKRDAAIIAAPVGATPTGYGELNLRSIGERVALSQVTPKSEEMQDVRAAKRKARRHRDRRLHGHFGQIPGWSL